MTGNRAVHHTLQAETEVLECQQCQEQAAPEQQDSLDDLYPGRGNHTAECHVDHHQHADADDCNFVIEPK
ncbi:hypothetical protein D9M71_323660 [compost metagenome]